MNAVMQAELEPLTESAPAASGRPTHRTRHVALLLGSGMALLACAGFAGAAVWRQAPRDAKLRGVISRQEASYYYPDAYGASPCGQATMGCTTAAPPPTPPCVPGTTTAMGCTTTPPPVPETLPATTPCAKPETLPANTPGDLKMVDSWALTYAWDEDDVDVYVITSPIMYEEFGETFGKMGLRHSGIAFKNRRTGTVSSAEFYAKKFEMSVVIPKVDVEAHTMFLDNEAVVATKEGSTLDTVYWTQTKLVATIKGPQYNAYIKWVETQTKVYSHYYLFNLAPEGTQVPDTQLHTASSPPAAAGFPDGAITCWEFAQDVLVKLKEIAGPEAFVAGFTMDRDDEYLWAEVGSTPRKLDMTPGSEDYEKAFAYFNALQPALGISVDADLPQILKSVYESADVLKLGYSVYIDQHMNYWMYTSPGEIGRYYVTPVSA